MIIEVSFPSHKINIDPAGAGDPPQTIVEAFPVGSIFISVNDVNPSELLGYGTWESFGAGKVLTGFDASDPDFDQSLKTGGNKTITPGGIVSRPEFSGDPLPKHYHEPVSAGTPVVKIEIIPSSIDRVYEVEAANKNPVPVVDNAHIHPGGEFSGLPLTPHMHPHISAGTPSGTISQPNFTGNTVNILSPYIVVHFWQRIS